MLITKANDNSNSNTRTTTTVTIKGFGRGEQKKRMSKDDTTRQKGFRTVCVQPSQQTPSRSRSLFHSLSLPLSSRLPSRLAGPDRKRSHHFSGPSNRLVLLLVMYETGQLAGGGEQAADSSKGGQREQGSREQRAGSSEQGAASTGSH